MGKTENADRMLTKHFGQQLQVNKRKPKFFVSLDWFVCVGNVKHCCRNENGSHPNLGFCICILHFFLEVKQVSLEQFTHLNNPKLNKL